MSLLSSATAMVALLGLAPSDYYDTDAFLALYASPGWLAWTHSLLWLGLSAVYGWLALSLWKRHTLTWLAASILVLLQLGSVIIVFISGDGIALLELALIAVYAGLGYKTRHW
jgi:hypothetical protein